MAAPRLEFKEDKEKKKGGTPAPPAKIRDPKKHSILSNLWSGIQSIPRGAYEQEETLRHAAAYDITHPGIHGLLGEALGRDRSALDKAAIPMAVESYETTRRATGTRGTKKFTEIWHDNPVAALGGVLIFAPPVARVAGISKMSTKIREANEVPTKDGGTRKMTRTEATRAATTESYYPGTLDKLGIKGSPFAPRVSGRRVSRTPTGRAGQRAFDWASEKIDTGIGVGARKTGPDTILSSTRREAAGKRRADDLDRGRLVTNAMRHVSTFADYLNDTAVSRVGTALGRRKETLASRDAAVGVALHASSAIDPVEAVRLGSEDTKAILASGKRDAHNGDIGDVTPDKRLGQTVWVTHGIDEDGKPIREESTVTADHGDRVTVATPQGEMTIPHGRAHLLGPNGEGQIPLNEDEVKMLTRRAALLDTAHEELLAEPRLQEKFRAATQSMTDLGQLSEQLGEDYFTRGMEPTGAEAMALLEKLTARRNQFLPRLGGEGVEAIDFTAGLWADLIKTMDQAGKLTEDQKLAFLQALVHAARVWASEEEGRVPADYLSSPEGKNIGGIDFSKPEDLEATANAMFQSAGERNHLVQTTTTVLIVAAPQVGNLVSTPKGMGTVIEFTDGEGGRMALVEMFDGANVREEFPARDLRVAQHPWIGHPQVNDYVMTPDGPGRVEAVGDGESPDWTPSYTVTVFDETAPGGYYVDGPVKEFKAGEVQRVENPRDMVDREPIFHLNSQQALADPKFPTKGTQEQYQKAFEKAGVKADELYWMGLSAIPMLKGEVVSTRAIVESIEKKMAENPNAEFKYQSPGSYQPSWISGDEMLAIRIPQRDAAEARLASYLEEPDQSMLLDQDWGGKTVPVKVFQDAIDSRAHFLDLKEHLYSSNAPDYQWRDKWGTGRSGALIIRDPTVEQPYHELVISLPDSELFKDGHFTRHGNEAPVVHIRFHEIIDNEGNRAILIDELQSDWNNVGRRQGFKELLSPRDKQKAAKMRDKERLLLDLYNRAGSEYGFGEADINNWYDRLIREKEVEINAEISARNEARRAARLERGDSPRPTPEDPDESILYGYGRDHTTIALRLEHDNANDPIFQDLMKARERFARINRKRQQLREAADAIETGGGGRSATNRGPLVMGDAAKYLAMKRMVRWAADHGQTRIIWTRGHEQGVRYSKYDDLDIRGGDDDYDIDLNDLETDDYYYPVGDTSIDLGNHYATRDVSEDKLHRMQQAQPIEVSFNDLDEYNDNYALLSDGHPADTGGTAVAPGQMSLVDEGADIPMASVARHPRWAKIVSGTDDGVVALPIDPKWDPATVDIEYRGQSGDTSYATYDVTITNRLGEKIYSGQLEGNFDHDDLLLAVKADWERPNRYRYGRAQSLGADPNQENLGNDSSMPGLGEDTPKMHQLLDILYQSDTFQSEFDRMKDYADHELDEDAYNEANSEYHQQQQDEHGYSSSGKADLEDIRDHDPPGEAHVRRLKAEIDGLKRKKKEDIERGVMSRDYDLLLRRTNASLDQAKKELENPGHQEGYDNMLPQMAERMLKPYLKEGDYSKVGIKERIYQGRYGVEEKGGTVSDYGDIHGWVMVLPAKMLEDAKRTTSLFQREAKSLTPEEIAIVKGLRDLDDLRGLSRQARRKADFGRAQAYEELVEVYGAENPLAALGEIVQEFKVPPALGRNHPNANYRRVLEAEMRRMGHALGDAGYPIFQKGNDIIKGASTWVGGPDGQRFVALTEHADFSTLMHEFIGHATEEMKRRYPELWEAVEIDMGKPLESWKVADHEKFAKYVERYWMEGKPPSPELATIMRMTKEWMKGVYSSITQLGKPMPESTRILLNRHLGQGVTARPGARTYVPHISQFDTMMDSAPGGTRLAAGGNVVGVPQVDRRNFGARRNRGILWQSGELALSARPIIDQYFRRTKFMETEAVRQELFDDGHPMPRNGRPPEGAWLVRNPEATPERLTARNKSKLSEEDFSRMIGEGDTPDEFVTKMEEIRRDHYAEPGEHPDWANDLENVRWVEAGKITQRLSNVFPSAPRGRSAASVGSLNSMARLTGIYLRPLHYLVGNIPQNVIMVALTNPAALVNAAKYGAYSFLPRMVREIGVQPRDLFAHDRHLYNQIKTETGDIQAGAGLPDFYTMANNTFQKAERRLNKISQGSAEKLGELADQPYRVSVWIAHAKGYGYNTPDEWRTLLNSERGTPDARIRDDIAQQTREDMIDFNTLNPWERQNISRFFYLWAFTRGFAKWPLTFAREYPGRTGYALTLADPEAEDDNGIPLRWLPSSGTIKTNKGKGKIRDLGFLDPTGGLRQQIETGIQVAHGNFSGVGGMATPPLETIIQAGTGGPRAPKGGLGGLVDQLARDTVPFWDIGRKAATPGLSISERVERVLDFHDRFGVKAEIGKGKNAEKKRKEDEKIRRVLTEAERLELLPQVMYQQDAYWHHKYLEQQIRFGAQARRKGTALTDEEKMTILYATAADYFPQASLPALTDALKGSAALQEKLRRDLSDAMFGDRNEVTGA